MQASLKLTNDVLPLKESLLFVQLFQIIRLPLYDASSLIKKNLNKLLNKWFYVSNKKQTRIQLKKVKT